MRTTAIGFAALAIGSFACTKEDPLAPIVPAVGQVTDATLMDQIDGAVARLRERPDDLKMRMQLAAVYDANGVPELATETYQQVVEIDPGHQRAWYHLGRMRQRTGDGEAALEAYARAVHVVPDYAPLHWRRGRILLSLGRVDEAGEAFGRSVALDPNDPDGLIGAARVRLERGEAREAAESLEDVVKRWPDYGRAARLLGRAWQEAGETEKALMILTGPIPDTKFRVDPWAKKVQGMKAGLTGDLKAAIAEQGEKGPRARIAALEELSAERLDDMAVLDELVKTLERAGNGDRALAVLEERRARRPEQQRIELLLAGAYERRRDLPKAIDHAYLAIQKAPEFGPAYFAMGRLRLETGDAEGAIEDIERAKALGASGPELEKALARARAEFAGYEKDGDE